MSFRLKKRDKRWHKAVFVFLSMVLLVLLHSRASTKANGDLDARMLKEAEEEVVPDWAKDVDDPYQVEQKERRIKLNIIVLTVTVLVVLSQLFEIGKEKLLEYTSEDMLPIIESLFAELTLLGFIGVSLFLVFQMKWIERVSEALYGEKAAIDELGESVHMVLFLVMVIFLMQAVAMARNGEASRKKWLQWESRKTGHMSATVEAAATDFLNATWWDLVLVQTYPYGLRALLYAATRESVLSDSNFDEGVFDFAHYLSVALGRTLAELVEVPVKTWLGLEVGLMAFFLLDYLMSNKVRVFLWTFIAYAALAAAFIVHGKIRQVLRHHLRASIQFALDQAHAEEEQKPQESDPIPPQENPRSESTHLQDLPPLTTTQLPSPLPAAPSPNAEKKPLSPRQQKKKPPYAKMPRSQSLNVARLQRIRAKDHVVSKRSPLTLKGKLNAFFDPYLTKARELTAPYLQKLHEITEPYLNKCIQFWQEKLKPALLSFWNSDSVQQIRAKAKAFFNLCRDQTKRAYHYVKDSSTHAYERIVVNDKDDVEEQTGDGYASLFWLGDKYKAEFTLDLIRVIPLFMSIYLAVFTLVYVPWIFRLCHSFGAHFGAILLLIISYLPAVSLQIKLPSVMEDFAIIAHIADMINLRFVEQVLSHQKTIAAFQALRVVACLRHPKLLTTIMKASTSSIDEDDEFTRAQISENCAEYIDAIVDQGEADEALERLIASDSEERRRRSSWANTFSLFDEHHRGVLNLEELSDMLLKFADDQDESRGHVDEIVSMLDADKSGEVSFDEFYDFGKKLEKYYLTTGDPQQLIHEIFHMIDRDHGGTITIEELHQTIQSIGLDLSLNVVYVRIF